MSGLQLYRVTPEQIEAMRLARIEADNGQLALMEVSA